MFELGGRHRCAGQPNKLDLCGVLSTRRRQFIIDADDECWVGVHDNDIDKRLSLRGKVRFVSF